MTPRPTSPTRRLARRALAASSVAALLLVTACGDDDDSADTTTTTTEAADDTTTTTAGDDDGDDDDGDDDGAGDDGGELLALLPDVSAIDSSYTEAPEDDEDEDDSADDGGIEDAMEEACPEAAALLDEDEDEDDTAEREYDGELERSITVGLDPTPRNLDEDTIDDAIAAIDACQTVTLTEDGMDMTVDLAAERDDTYGDRGVVMTMNLSMSHPQLPAPITLEMRGRIFQVGSLGAQVNVMSGFDETTLEPVEGDFDLLDTLAAELESAAAEHEG